MSNNNVKLTQELMSNTNYQDILLKSNTDHNMSNSKLIFDLELDVNSVPERIIMNSSDKHQRMSI